MGVRFKLMNNLVDVCFGLDIIESQLCGFD